jgi:hypothetical protein
MDESAMKQSKMTESQMNPSEMNELKTNKPEPNGSSDWTRPEPKRTGPHRNGWAKGHAGGHVKDVASTTVEQAVRLGYKVIENNIEMGKAFASRHSSERESGTQDDLIQLCGKMLQLGRDFTSLYFDALEQVLQEVSERTTRKVSKDDDSSPQP